MTHRYRRLGKLVFALVACALLAGCVTLPHNSSVDQGRELGSHPRARTIRYSPPPPQPGASKLAIIHGYIDAMLAFPQSPALVRQFLTPHGIRVWDPHDLLEVYANPHLTVTSKTQVDFKVDLLGSLGLRGSWVSATLSPTFSPTLSLAKVAGQWRIDNPPPGTLLDADTFQRYYHEHSLYFFDPAHTVVAPDPVYDLVGGPDATATALVRNLLGGPTPAMDGVVTTVLPITTQVDGRVTISAIGTAFVPLTSQVDALSVEQLNLLATQLAWTLNQPSLGIKRIAVTSNGEPVKISKFGARFPVFAPFFAQYGPSGFSSSRNLYALAAGHLVVISPNGTEATIQRSKGAIGTLDEDARSASIDVGANNAALVIDKGTKVDVGPIQPADGQGDTQQTVQTWFSGGVDLLKPSWDAQNLLWLVDRTPDGGAVVRVANGTTVQIVDAPGIEGEDVRSFAVSRDGMRFAAIIENGGDSQLVISMIHRNPVTSRVSLTGALPVGISASPLVDLTQLAWFSPTMVTVLAQAEGSEPQPYQIAVDGSRIQAPTGLLPVGAMSVAADANSLVPPIIGTSDGRLYIRTPNQQWPLLRTPPGWVLRSPTYPG